jgi:RNA:NAD 2'-phosphotransferase (TPT1/KptA family)
MRSYDLKGSTIERKVWDDYNDIPEKINKTLKDLDFKNIEERLALDSKKRFTVYD